MRKILTKIICFAAAAVAAFGVTLGSGCATTFNSKSLGGDYSSGTVDKYDNGGFAVKKGNYIYFINGKETNTADNTYGNVVKGAIMRISTTDFANRNYANVQTVVPQIAYSGNNNAGIFVYGDYVYYATPSTEKNSDGEVQNSYLAFKSTKLDGTESMKDYYAQYSNNSIEYRFVEEDGVVYLIYVATSETLYGESSGVTNIHSVNTKTGKDTLLVYNAASYTFDKNNLTNPRIYYTMKVPNYISGKTSTFSSYNQIYTVTAKATETADYSQYIKDSVADYDEKEDGPLYVNCGTLVLDGFGKVDGMKQDVTPFNGEGAANVDRPALEYTLAGYQNGTLLYTRSSKYLESLLFAVKESDVLKSDWKPVAGNPADEDCLSDNGSAASSYIYLFNESGDISYVIIANTNGFIRAAIKDGKIDSTVNNSDVFYLKSDVGDSHGQPTVLFIDETNNYIYYSLSGGNGYTVNRVNYTGTHSDYNTPFAGEEINQYTPVTILDLDSASDWYKPEIIDGQLLFPAQVKYMTDHVYILACDLRSGSGILDNEGIDALNKKFFSITDDIEAVDPNTYENLQDALWYAYYTGDADYIDTLIKAYVDIKGYNEERFWSKESVALYKDFVNASGDKWGKYASDKVKVNGKDVTYNMRDYYYALLGKMTETEEESFLNDLKATFLESYPEKEKTWFESLSTGEQAGFIIGVCAGGLIVIAAAVTIVVLIVKKRKRALPEDTKKRVKVDTTDDKDIDVYSD